MNRPLTRLASTAAVATYLLIVLGGIVRISGSGLGCGDEWPVCHGRLIPSFADVTTLIEWSHRLVAGIVSLLVATLAAGTWWQRHRSAETRPGTGGYVALALLAVQVFFGAVTVRLHLPPWTVVLHLGTAMALFAVLLYVALGEPPFRPALPALAAVVLGFVTILLGAMTANLGAARACAGFPLCNGQVMPAAQSLAAVQWTHRLFAYGLFAYLLLWTAATRRRGPALVLGMATLQIGVAAAMILLGLPRGLQATHVAVGALVWAVLVIVALRDRH
jgi:heme A synthase